MNRFIFVAPMYNASDTLPRMLHSIYGQSYENWKIVLIDDVSGEKHVLAAQKHIDNFESLRPGHLTFLRNTEKKWEVANVLRGISFCEEDDIVCRIDADDWLTDLDTLAILDQVYNQTSADAVWTAHRWSFSDKNISGPLPADADPYAHPWVSSHLKTFRKRLITSVKDENFRGPDGDYIRRAGDQAIYLPVLKRSKTRVFVPRVMYHYTIKDEPQTYQTEDAKFQRDEAVFLRQRGYIE